MTSSHRASLVVVLASRSTLAHSNVDRLDTKGRFDESFKT